MVSEMAINKTKKLRFENLFRVTLYEWDVWLFEIIAIFIIYLWQLNSSKQLYSECMNFLIKMRLIQTCY